MTFNECGFFFDRLWATYLRFWMAFGERLFGGAGGLLRQLKDFAFLIWARGEERLCMLVSQTLVTNYTFLGFYEFHDQIGW